MSGGYVIFNYDYGAPSLVNDELSVVEKLDKLNILNKVYTTKVRRNRDVTGSKILRNFLNSSLPLFNLISNQRINNKTIKGLYHTEFSSRLRFTNEMDYVLNYTPFPMTLAHRKAHKNNIPFFQYLPSDSSEDNMKIIFSESRKFGINKKLSITSNNTYSKRYREVIKKNNNLISLAPFVSKNLTNNYGVDEDKIYQMKYGPGGDPNIFKPAKVPPKDFTPLFLGNNSFIKGLGYLLLGLKNLKLDYGCVNIVGQNDNTLLSKFNRYVKFKNLGFQEETLPIYQNSSVYVLPTLSDPWPQTLMEAMNCGLPVITTKRAGNSHIIDDGQEGFVVPTRNYNEITKKLQYFIDNPSEIIRMGKNARRKASKYTHQKFSDEMSKHIYEKVYEKDV